VKIKYIVIIAFSILILGSAIAFWWIFYKPQKDYGSSKPDITISAKDFMKEFDADENAANKKFITGNKTIQVIGKISEINKNSDGTVKIILGDTGFEGTISCTLMPDQTTNAEKYKKGDNVSIKGQCTGMQALLDKEIIMIRCAFSKN
jgi:hypothetical protein